MFAGRARAPQERVSQCSACNVACVACVCVRVPPCENCAQSVSDDGDTLPVNACSDRHQDASPPPTTISDCDIEHDWKHIVEQIGRSTRRHRRRRSCRRRRRRACVPHQKTGCSTAKLFREMRASTWLRYFAARMRCTHVKRSKSAHAITCSKTNYIEYKYIDRGREGG